MESRSARTRGISRRDGGGALFPKVKPGWLTRKALQAWRALNSRCRRSATGVLARTSSDVKIETPSLSPDAASDELPEAVHNLLPRRDSALLVQHNSGTAYSRIDDELKARASCLRTPPPAPRSRGSRQGEALRARAQGYDKFAALSAAAFAAGRSFTLPRVDVGADSRATAGSWSVDHAAHPRRNRANNASVVHRRYASADAEAPSFSAGRSSLHRQAPQLR